MLGTKATSIPMSSEHLHDNQSEPIDSKSYKTLMEKLRNVTFSRPDICIAVRKLSQFMDKPIRVDMQLSWFLNIFSFLKPSLEKVYFLEGAFF